MKVTQNTVLLSVGPLPPPFGGTTVSYQIFCDELRSQFPDIQHIVIDTSQKRLKRNMSVISTGNVGQAIRICRQFLSQVHLSQCALIFGSNGFQLSMMPILLWTAKLFKKPCYVRPFGGSLDNYVRGLNPLLRWWLMQALKGADGLIVETELLRREFALLGVERLQMVAGYRPIPSTEPDAAQRAPMVTDASETALRLVFVGHVREEKGVFVLLEALQQLADAGITHVSCDIYGPIYPGIAERFQKVVERIPSATYHGVLEPDRVIDTLRHYDALIFPTFYQGEGHPGVVIEAMIAGLAVITTDFRAVPELIHSGNNGLLVPPRDAEALASAIVILGNDPQLRQIMGQRNRALSRMYDAQALIPQLVQMLNLPEQAYSRRAAPQSSR